MYGYRCPDQSLRSPPKKEMESTWEELMEAKGDLTRRMVSPNLNDSTAASEPYEVSMTSLAVPVGVLRSSEDLIDKGSVSA